MQRRTLAPCSSISVIEASVARNTQSSKTTPANRKRLKRILEHIEAEITLGTFDYGKYFPNSPRAKEFAVVEERVHQLRSGLPDFGEFAETWYSQVVVEWRDSYASTIRATLDRHLIPHFGERALDAITKADLLDFRVELSRKKGKKNDTLSAERINHIMTPLRMILNEAASRYEFPTPYQGIKSLKVPKTKVEPFTLVEVKRILETVRADFRPYYTVRFFTGMRTGEVDGLQWKYVDFERREIHVAESWVKGKMTTTKTDGSDRIIHMSQVVHDALKEQQKVTGKQRYVFCNRNGAPLNHNNVTKRVWYPLLRYLGLPERRPYQTRHYGRHAVAGCRRESGVDRAADGAYDDGDAVSGLQPICTEPDAAGRLGIRSTTRKRHRLFTAGCCRRYQVISPAGIGKSASTANTTHQH
jgi:integrase